MLLITPAYSYPLLYLQHRLIVIFIGTTIPNNDCFCQPGYAGNLTASDQVAITEFYLIVRG